MPEESGAHKDTLIVPVDYERDEKFLIPATAAQSPSAFNEVIDLMNDYANYPVESINVELRQVFIGIVKDRFGAAIRAGRDLASPIGVTTCNC